MGSTGHGLYNHSNTGDNGNDTFGIAGAVNYKGEVPDGSNIKKPGAGKITLKAKANDGNNVIFQFSLTKDSREMIIVGFKDGVPQVRAKVEVSSGRPSLDKVIASGKKGEKQQAIKMKELFAQSTKIKENQLNAIAQQLLNKKRSRGE